MSDDRKMEDIFALIHRKQALKLLEILESEEPLTAQELNAISKFLSDNNVTGIKETDAGLKSLSDGLAAFESGSTIPTRQ